ncbi:MAG: mechanosensitive ion channel [Rhodocyclaceae bacterium]|nr:mechanosensitive ion channel [Rhodocyclaceae bacterium]MBK6907615.1 mechanosensitive ion channel [Rhodocyclaceae bacterium]
MQGELNNLLQRVLEDIRQPDIIWQLCALTLCLVIAKLVERVFVRKSDNGTQQGRVWQLGRGSLRRIAFPLIAASLILALRPLLKGVINLNVLSLALPLLFSLAGIRMVFYVLRHSFSGSPWLANFERGFAFAAWGLVALHITGVLPEVIDALDSLGVAVGKQRLTLWQVLQGAATVMATVLGALWVSGMIEARLNAADGLDSNLREVFARISKALLIVIGVLISLPLVGIDLTTLSVFGGALGVGLGLGLQKIASNYVSGFIILLERSIRIGNVIAVGENRGEVTRITTRYTVLRSVQGIESLVPNELLVGTVVQNESYSDHKVRIALPVQVSYDTDIAQADSVMIAAAQAQDRVLKSPPPLVLLKNFGESGIDLELGIWIQDPEEGTGVLRSDINRAILSGFRAQGISIPYPQREVRVLGSEAMQ